MVVAHHGGPGAGRTRVCVAAGASFVRAHRVLRAVLVRITLHLYSNRSLEIKLFDGPPFSNFPMPSALPGAGIIQ